MASQEQLDAHLRGLASFMDNLDRENAQARINAVAIEEVKRTVAYAEARTIESKHRVPAAETQMLGMHFNALLSAELAKQIPGDCKCVKCLAKAVMDQEARHEPGRIQISIDPSTAFAAVSALTAGLNSMALVTAAAIKTRTAPQPGKESPCQSKDAKPKDPGDSASP